MRMLAWRVVVVLVSTSAFPQVARADEVSQSGGITFKREYSIGDIMNAITAVATIVAVVYAARAFVADHDRRRKQATMERMAALRSEYREKWLKISSYGTAPITDAEAKEIEADPARRKELEDLLSLFEHLATGVNCDVFDLHVLNRTSGQYLMDVFDRCRSYMALVRADEKKKHRPSKYYVEFYVMVNNIRKLRCLKSVELP